VDGRDRCGASGWRQDGRGFRRSVEERSIRRAHQDAGQLHCSAAPSSDDEVVRVVSAGTLSYGMGDKLDKSNVGSLTKGYHVTMQSGMNHYVFTTDPVDVQVNGTGPFQIVYVDPKDDPRGAK
jgi:hypothetical protein